MTEEEKKKKQIIESENQLLLDVKRKEENDEAINLIKKELLEKKSALHESETSKNIASSQLIEKTEEIELLKQKVADNQILFEKNKEVWENEEQSIRNKNSEDILGKDEEIIILKNLISEAELKTNLLTEQLEENRLFLSTEKADRIECDKIALETLTANNTLRAAQRVEEEESRIEMERKREELLEIEKQRNKAAAIELSESHASLLTAKDRYMRAFSSARYRYRQRQQNDCHAFSKLTPSSFVLLLI